MKTLRSFIAIPLTQTLQDAAKDVQDILKITGADIGWVKPHNIHLTLKFLGDLPEEKIEPISAVMKSIVESTQSFAFQMTHAGAFPDIERPQVIWLGLTEGKEKIKNVVEDLESGLEKLGLKKEKRDFDPHITLGRVRSGLNRFALQKSLNHLTITPTTQDASTMTLYKSTLTPQGPIYDILYSVPFAPHISA